MWCGAAIISTDLVLCGSSQLTCLVCFPQGLFAVSQMAFVSGMPVLLARKELLLLSSAIDILDLYEYNTDDVDGVSSIPFPGDDEPTDDTDV